ncbi:hypothetical protein [Nonomuraea rubra]|uniref:Uncharacterized protein n=1 Tax=Nonomuraea rubra TaxID=46180 RepID=A0A7X0U0T4_9ACTN|nr:hypothetical protein [Nonomuraea rubra]MBB6550709.1 hypothetical protein [Nonomuraea rubra]
MGNESVLCPVCRRVLPATGKESYTPLRGRLIVTNGYCAGGCAEAAGQAQQQQAQQQTQQMVRPQAAPSPVPMPDAGQGQAPLPQRAPLRVVR